MRKKRTTMTAEVIRSIDSLMNGGRTRIEISKVLGISETTADKYYLLITALKNSDEETLSHIASTYFNDIKGAKRAFDWICSVLYLPRVSEDVLRKEEESVNNEAQITIPEYKHDSEEDECDFSLDFVINSMIDDIKQISNGLKALCDGYLSLYNKMVDSKEEE